MHQPLSYFMLDVWLQMAGLTGSVLRRHKEAVQRHGTYQMLLTTAVVAVALAAKKAIPEDRIVVYSQEERSHGPDSRTKR